MHAQLEFIRIIWLGLYFIKFDNLDNLFLENSYILCNIFTLICIVIHKF